MEWRQGGWRACDDLCGGNLAGNIKDLAGDTKDLRFGGIDLAGVI